MCFFCSFCFFCFFFVRRHIINDTVFFTIPLGSNKCAGTARSGRTNEMAGKVFRAGLGARAIPLCQREPFYFGREGGVVWGGAVPRGEGTKFTYICM